MWETHILLLVVIVGAYRYSCVFHIAGFRSTCLQYREVQISLLVSKIKLLQLIRDPSSTSTQHHKTASTNTIIMNRLGRLLIVLSFSFECLSFQPQLSGSFQLSTTTVSFARAKSKWDDLKDEDEDVESPYETVYPIPPGAY